MRVAIINLTGGGISGGYRRYLEAMLPRLAASPEIEQILCASPPSLALETLFQPDPKITFMRCNPFRFLRHKPDQGLKLALDALRPDVLFVPLERRIDYAGLPLITMIQNMAPLAEINTTSGFTEKAKSIAQRFEAKIAIKKSDHVIAPTSFVKNALIKRWAIPEKKISIIHYGAAPANENNSKKPLILKGMDPGEFIFTAGSIESYRGLEDLITLMARWRRTQFRRFKLVIAGDSRPGTRTYHLKLKKLADSSGVSGNIVWTGNLGPEELSWCYSNCSVFVMTSRVESFGLVALEAIAHGCNCVSTDSPCLPEIFQDTAVYYRAGNIQELNNAASAVSQRSKPELNKFSRLARERASSFSWDKTAEQTVKVLLQAAGKSKIC